jgi:hypothetical protein
VTRAALNDRWEASPDDNLDIDEIEPSTEASPLGSWENPDREMFEDGRPPAPAFPMEALGRWSAWVSDLAASKSAPVDYAAAGLLAAGAACLGDARHVSPWPGWEEPAALWLAMVGDPSTAKSPIFSPLKEVIHAIEREENEDFDARRRSWEADKRAADEHCQQWEADVTAAVKENRPRPDKPDYADEPEAPAPARIVTSDATREALAVLHKTNPRGLILCRDELAGWVGDFDKYGGGGEAAFFLSRFNGDSLTIDRKRDGNITVPRALLSVFGGIQPEPFHDLLLKRADDGFVSRVLFAFPNPAPRVRPTATADMGLLKVALRRLRGLPFDLDEQQHPVARVVPLSPEAVKEFERWWKVNGEDAAMASGFAAGSLGKAPGVVLRLALELQYLDWSAGPDSAEPVSLSDVAVLRAITLYEDYFAPMAERVFGGARLSKDEIAGRALARRLQSERRPIVNVQDLRGARGMRTTAEVNAALAWLAGGGWVRPSPGREGSTSGRQRNDWEINSALWSMPR